MIYWDKWESPKMITEHIGDKVRVRTVFGEWKSDDDRVSKISFYGYMSAGKATPIGMGICLFLKDGTRKEFDRDIADERSQSSLIQEAEAWLATLPADPSL